MEDEAGEENDEEVVGVPEDLEIAASDHLHGRGDDEDEGQGDDDAREAGDGGEDKVGGNLLRILESSSNYNQVLTPRSPFPASHSDLTDLPHLRQPPDRKPMLCERKMACTHELGDSDGVQVGGVAGVLQVGQGGAEFVVNSLPAVVVPLHVQQVGDHVNGCRDTKKRVVSSDCWMDGAAEKNILYVLNKISREKKKTTPLANICSESVFKLLLKPFDTKARVSLKGNTSIPPSGFIHVNNS